MIASAQAKVLRVLQTGEFTRVGGETGAEGRRARRRRDQPGPAGGGRRRAVPRGPVLPPERGAAARAAAARARRRHAAAVAVVRASCLPRERHEGEADLRRGGGRCWPRLPLAGQRARAAQRGRAAGDPVRREHRRRRSARGDRRRGRRAAGARRPPAATELPRVELPAEARALPLREFRDHMEREYIRIKLDENDWNISRTATLLGHRAHQPAQEDARARPVARQPGPRARLRAGPS